jgi:succinate dehydrogenase / fumarate reductase, membrane anchor subunit
MARSFSSRPRPASTGSMNFEVISWYFFRISGLVLIFMAIIHLVLMHIVTDVSQTSYDFVANRYQNPFWRVYDLLLLSLALLHGMNGVRILVDDYIHSHGWRLAWQSFTAIITLVFLLMGAMTILTFHPGNAPLATFFGAIFNLHH